MSCEIDDERETRTRPDKWATGDNLYSCVATVAAAADDRDAT